MAEGENIHEVELSKEGGPKSTTLDEILDKVPHFGTKRKEQREKDEIQRLSKEVAVKLFRVLLKHGILTNSRKKTDDLLLSESYEGNFQSKENRYWVLGYKNFTRDNSPAGTKISNHLHISEIDQKQRKIDIIKYWDSEEWDLKFTEPLTEHNYEESTKYGIAIFPRISTQESIDLLHAVLNAEFNLDGTQQRYAEKVDDEKNPPQSRDYNVQIMWAKDRANYLGD